MVNCSGTQRAPSFRKDTRSPVSRAGGSRTGLGLPCLPRPAWAYPAKAPIPMKLLIFACVSLLGLTAAPLQAQTCSLIITERETAAPQADAELRGLARQQAAVLADLLRLSQTQMRCLQKAQYEKLWQLRVQEEAQPAGQPVPAAE